jgi:drug/metabolite transporter (DMT)-like permease
MAATQPSSDSTNIETPARRWQDHLLAGAFVVLWCSGYPAGKIAIQHGGPFTLLLWRFALAAAIFGLLALLGRAARPARACVMHSVIVGVLSLAISFGGVYSALKLGVSSGIAALIIGAMPLSTALCATVIGERLAWRQWVGLALGFVGVALVLDGRLETGAGTVTGYAAAVVGLFSLSIGTLYQKRHSVAMDLRVGLAVQHLAAFVVMLPLAAFLEHFAADWSAAYSTSLAWLVLVNAVGGFALFFVLLRRGAATDVAALFYLMPPITAVMSFFVLGEKLTLPMLPGFALVVAGIWLGTRNAK